MFVHKKTSKDRQVKNAEDKIRKEKADRHQRKAQHSIPLSTDVSQVRKEKKAKTFKKLMQTKRVKTVLITEQEAEALPESRVSRLIVNQSVKQLFLIVLVTSLVFVLLDINQYVTSPTSYYYGLTLLETLNGTPHYKDAQQEYTNWETDMTHLIYLQVQHNDPWFGDTAISALRSVELVYIYTNSSVVVLDAHLEMQLLSALNICKTAFICLLLLGCAVSITHDFQVVVIFALERMLQTVRKIAKDPLLLLSEGPLVTEARMAKSCWCWRSREDYSAFELKLLEDTFKKIGVMLALGFGTAGCEIISASLKSASSLNPLIPGRKVFAVFTFITIHHFDRLALELKRDVLFYVNHVARAVHSASETCLGQINKNLGDAFLLVWKLRADDAVVTSTRYAANPFSSNVRLHTTLALLSAAKIVKRVARSSKLQQYTRLTNIPCEVSVGLHLGWAFEGPIGSQVKIDATYLSPHVNLTSRIESVAKLFHVYILTSEDFSYRLEDPVRAYLRHIDTVVLKGTEIPMSLYSFDLSLLDLGVSKHEICKAKVQMQKRKMKEAFEYNYFTPGDLITESSQIAMMRRSFQKEFFDAYQSGLGLYQSGKWKEAKEILKNKCLRLIPEDGPSLELVSYMANRNFQAPIDWPGYRVLMGK